MKEALLDDACLAVQIGVVDHGRLARALTASEQALAALEHGDAPMAARRVRARGMAASLLARARRIVAMRTCLCLHRGHDRGDASRSIAGIGRDQDALCPAHLRADRFPRGADPHSHEGRRGAGRRRRLQGLSSIDP